MNCTVETDSDDLNAGFIERKIQKQVRENREKSKQVQISNHTMQG